MAKYLIGNTASGVSLGLYDGEDEAGAIAAMMADAGHAGEQAGSYIVAQPAPWADPALVREYFNCREATVDREGDIWIEGPQRGHWIGDTAVLGYIDWVARQAVSDDDLSDLDMAMTEPHAVQPREEAVRVRQERAEAEGDFDRANELDAELPSDSGCSSCEAIGNPEHADRLHNEIRDLNVAISRMRKEYRAHVAQLHTQMAEITCMSPEEFATRAYLEAMVAAGWTLLLGTPVERDGRDTMEHAEATVDEIVASLLTGTTSYRLRSPDGCSDTHICGSLKGAL